MTALEIANFDGLDEETARELQDILDRIPKGWGKWLSFGKGWIPLVIQLNKDIRALVPDYEVHQVKEKFAGLRYYIGPFEPPVAQCCEDVRAYLAEHHPFPRSIFKDGDVQNKHREIVNAIWEMHNADPVFSVNHEHRETLRQEAAERYDAHEAEIVALIRIAETKSFTTCEECSAPATTHLDGHYYMTLCAECGVRLGATEVPKKDEE